MPAMWPLPSPSMTSRRCSSVSVRQGTSVRIAFRLQSFSSSPRSHVVVFVVHGRRRRRDRLLRIRHDEIEVEVDDAAEATAGSRTRRAGC
jgi:hypothetical protein